MSAEKTNTPNWGEIEKANELMDRDQIDSTLKRMEGIDVMKPSVNFSQLDEDFSMYRAQLNRLETSLAAKWFPPEWKGDIEKARKLESEIQERLTELEGLFKIHAPEPEL